MTGETDDGDVFVLNYTAAAMHHLPDALGDYGIAKVQAEALIGIGQRLDSIHDALVIANLIRLRDSDALGAFEREAVTERLREAIGYE